MMPPPSPPSPPSPPLPPEAPEAPHGAVRRDRRASVSAWLAYGPAILLLLVALFGPALAEHCGLDPLRPDIAAALSPPSSTHWFGTDVIGRDLFARVLLAARLDLSIACAAVMLSALPGVVLGVLCGFHGGAIDRAVQRVVTVSMAFPLFVIALALAAVFGNSIASIVLATAAINFPFYVRLARTETAVRRDARYVTAARMSGWSDARIMRRVIVPNILPSIIVQMTVNVGWAMINGAGLSFLGLGIRPPTAEWGVLVGEGAGYVITGQWWLAAFPGLALGLSVLALTLAGDRLRDHFDPRRR